MRNRPYVVRQGDYLTQLAHRMGVDAETVWSHSDNDALREQRAHHDILQPGDVLQLPEQTSQPTSLRSGTTNHFRANVPRVRVRVLLQDPASQAASNKRYTARGNGFSLEGTTEQNGLVTFEVPVHVREVRLEVENGRTYQITVGGLDPINEPSGVDRRLIALGYLHISTRNSETVTTGMRKAAIAAFQIANQLPATGQLTDETLQTLSRVYGS